MHPRCMHTVSIREPVISSGWHGIHTGGRTCLSCLKAEGKTMPGGFLSSPVFPTLRHLLMSSAALINCVLRGNPALCFQALLAVMRGLGCSLISAKVPFKRVSVFSKIPPSSLTFSPQLSPLKTLLAADVCWFADMASNQLELDNKLLVESFTSEELLRSRGLFRQIWSNNSQKRYWHVGLFHSNFSSMLKFALLYNFNMWQAFLQLKGLFDI